jgi:CRISPR-associated endonuclease/helicase Cas3
VTDLYPDYFKYWGKADRDDPTKYHLLPYHCLDVAAVGWLLLDPGKTICKELARKLEVTTLWLRDFLVFFLALHDLGKFSRTFQGLRPNLSPGLVKPNPRMPYSVRHDTLGFLLFGRNPSGQFVNIFEDSLLLNAIEPWLEIVTGHHGMPPQKTGMVADSFEQEDEEAASQFAKEAMQLFLPEFDHAPLLDNGLKKRLKMVSWQLAGITVLADWQGSNRGHFDHVKKPIELSRYWNEYALPSATKAIHSMPVKPKIRQFPGISDLFPFIQHPTPLQEYSLNEPLSDKPQLFILEDVTGAGKTEAALILTHRLLDAGLADGLYVALPTMATANAMYKRLRKVYRRFYDAGEQPSLILAHGARDLSDEFQESVMLPENQPVDLNYSGGDEKKDQELSATAYCNAWLADNRKKALLADVGVGTLDQALLAVLPARHQSLRLLGLSRKVLLVDEVHAYDCYMQKLLDALLEAHARQGGSVIMLSATLPGTMRENLVTAFHRGLGDAPFEILKNAYPLATHSPGTSDCEKHIDTREEVKRTVTVKRLAMPEAAIDQIRQAMEKGQCVCWIRNTVKAARESHHELAEYEWMDRNHLHLFHSRFVMIDRQGIEAKCEKIFGDKSMHPDRKGQVLIATQVVEQSLDLDFDVLITDLAPVDLVLQRAGRLQRHVRDARGNRLRGFNEKDQRGKPILYLYAPEPMENPEADWLKSQQKGTQAVYPHVGQLWLTAKLLLKDKNGEFTMPEDARSLIEGVYAVDIEDSVPVNLRQDSYMAIGQEQSRKSMADFNALKLNKGYTRLSGDWDEEIRYPTRLTEEESVSVVLARLHNGKLQPHAAGSHHPWAMSVVKIPEWEWKEASRQIPTKLQKMIEELKKEVNALRWLEVFPLAAETADYYNDRDGWQPTTGERK